MEALAGTRLHEPFMCMVGPWTSTVCKEREVGWSP